jgi:hypothetical protein
MGALSLTTFISLIIAFSVMAQDPTLASRKAAKIEFENDRIRVLRVHYEPHEKSQMREHLARVVVSLTNTQSREILPDGTSRELHSRAGTVQWREPEQYAVENMFNDAIDEIEIELKQAKAPGRAVSRPPSVSPLPKEPMPTSLEPHHHVKYENQYIRVMEVSLQPGESSLFHTHSFDVVYVTLADATARAQEMGKEWGMATAFKVGGVSVDEAARSPHTHHLQNIGTTRFHTINIEILQ